MNLMNHDGVLNVNVLLLYLHLALFVLITVGYFWIQYNGRDTGWLVGYCVLIGAGISALSCTGMILFYHVPFTRPFFVTIVLTAVGIGGAYYLRERNV